jgi:hypothetical protein
MAPNLFEDLFTYRPRFGHTPEENFLTASLSQALNDNVGFRRDLLARLGLQVNPERVLSKTQLPIRIKKLQKTLDLVLMEESEATPTLIAMFEIKWNATESFSNDEEGALVGQTELYKKWFDEYDHRHPQAIYVYLSRDGSTLSDWTPLSWSDIHALARQTGDKCVRCGRFDLATQLAQFLELKGEGTSPMDIQDAMKVAEVSEGFKKVCKLLVKIGQQARKEPSTQDWRFQPGNSPTVPAASLFSNQRFQLYMEKGHTNHLIVWSISPHRPKFARGETDGTPEPWIAVWLQVPDAKSEEYKNQILERLPDDFIQTGDNTCLFYTATPLSTFKEEGNFETSVVKFAASSIVKLAEAMQ